MIVPRRKRISLLPEWRRILKRAWSIRLGVLAALLSAVEVIVPLFADAMPRGVFAAASGISVMAAMVARLIAQKQDDK